MLVARVCSNVPVVRKMTEDVNPFKMPTDEEVFALRDEEQQRKQQERERVKQLHVWEKGVAPGPAAVRHRRPRSGGR